MPKLRFQFFVLVFALVLAGCEGNSEDPVIPSGITDPAELTQSAFQKQEIGAFEEAIEILNKALEIDPKFVPAHFRMGSVYEEWDQRKEATIAYQNALALDPNHINARLGLASAYGKSRKNVYEHMKEWDNSLKEIAISLQLGNQTGNQQAVSIAENKLLFLKGRMNLTEAEMERRTKPPFN